MKKIFLCSNCQRQFDKQNECLQHQQQCKGTKVVIKQIFINDVNDKIEVGINIYQDAVFKFNIYYLQPYMYECAKLTQEEIKFDQINHIEQNTPIIFTTNLDKQHETYCINKLIDFYIAKNKKMLQKYNNQIKILSQKNYQTDIHYWFNKYYIQK